jgi:hypothetical protein
VAASSAENGEAEAKGEAGPEVVVWHGALSKNNMPANAGAKVLPILFNRTCTRVSRALLVRHECASFGCNLSKSAKGFFQGLKNYPHVIAPNPRVTNGISIFAIWFSAVWLLCQYLFRSQ